jgi:hypothetical protein
MVDGILGDWKLDQEKLEALKSGYVQLFTPYTIDLSTARTKEEFLEEGDTILIQRLDGIASIYPSSRNHPEIQLQFTRKINTPFDKFYLTNTAQTGKTLQILIGRDAGFLASGLEVVGLVDLNGSDIAPAKDFTTGNPYVEEKTITTAGTAEDVDINTALGRNAHHGFVKALSTNTDEMKVKFSSDASTYTANYLSDLQKNQSFDLDGMDIDTLRIDSAVSGEGVLIVVW